MSRVRLAAAARGCREASSSNIIRASLQRIGIVSIEGRTEFSRRRRNTNGASTTHGNERDLAPALVACLSVRADDGSKSEVAYRLILDRGHPWRPPFGLDRVGRPPAVVVQASDRPAGAGPILAVLKRGKEIGRQAVAVPGESPLLRPGADRRRCR